MKNRFVSFISLAISVIIFVSCCNNDDNYYDLSSEELSLLPYKINDSIVLKNFQNDDTITFFCENVENKYYCWDNKTPFCDNEDCDQNFNVHFISNDSSKLKLEMYASLTSGFASMSLYFENSENLTIFNTIHTVIDSIYVNGILYTEVHRFKQRSIDNQFYVKSNKGLIKIKSFEIIYELIE